MKKTLSFFVALAFGCFSLFAQGDTTMSFSLKQAQEYALEHSRSLQNSALSIRQVQADRWASIASMLPQVSASLDYSNSLGYKMEFGAMSISMPPSGSLGVNVAMALSGAQIVSTQIAKIAVDMANVQKLQTEQDIVQQVKLLYYSALVSQQTQSLLEESLKTIKKLHEFVNKSVEVGVAEKVDADQILVQVATMETTLNTSKRSLEMVYNSLRLTMNIPFNVEIVLSDSMEDLLNVEESLKLIYDDFILDNNYSYQLAKKGVDLTKQQKNMSAWTYGPTLSAFYQYSGKHYFSDEARMNMTPPNMIGISLSIPIFSSGRNFETVRKANIEYKKQLNNLSDTEMALNIQHRQLKYNLSSAYERYQTQKRSVEVSQSVFDNISTKYEFGLSSSLDVTNSATNLLSAQSSYVQAILEYVNAQIELEKLLNKN